MVKNEKITNSLTKTKTKTKKQKKIENENEKIENNRKTCHSTKVLAYNMALTGATAVRGWIRD